MASPDSTLIYLGGAPYLARPLPLMGTRICSGFPSPADDFLDGELDLTRLVAPNRPATFLWRVTYDAGKALHAAAKLRGEHGFAAHWAGQGAPLARMPPVAELVGALHEEWRVASQS